MLFPVNLFVFAITAEACIDNLLWKDTYGWTCRDYTRDPNECRSNYAVSDEGIVAQEACCACVTTVERRRDEQECRSICLSSEDVCNKKCDTDKRSCNFKCIPATSGSNGNGGNGGVVETPEPTKTEVVENAIKLEWWMILLIVLAILLCLCVTCIVLYFICMTRDAGTCEDDDCPTQQPMLVGGGCDVPGDNPCGTPCDNPGLPCDNPGPQMVYNQVPAGYSQGQMW